MNLFVFLLTVGTQPVENVQPQQPGRLPLAVFEKQIGALAKEKVMDRSQLIRAFAAGLRERDEKLAAIAITDSRFVYLLSRDERNLLLSPLLKDQDEQVRWRALRAIGLNGLGGKHFDTVSGMFKDANAKQLPEVISAMTRSGDERFLPFLRTALKHPDGTIRAGTAFGLGQGPLRGKVETDLKLLWNDPHPQVRYNLTWIFADDTAKLRERLKDASPHVRGAALRIIGESKRAEAANDAAALLNDADAHIRGQAATALGLLKNPMHVKLIIGLLEDADVYPRRTAVMALEQYQDPKLAPNLVEMLRDRDNQVREYAARALGKLKTPAHAKAVLPLLNDENVAVRYMAAITLVRWTGAEHAKAIEQMVVTLKGDRFFGLGDGYGLIRELTSEAFLPTLALLAENSLWRDAALQQQQMIREKRTLPQPRLP